MTTPDEHIAVLKDLAAQYEYIAGDLGYPGPQSDAPVVDRCRAKAAAIRWVLSLNAYGVTEDEVVG